MLMRNFHKDGLYFDKVPFESLKILNAQWISVKGSSSPYHFLHRFGFPCDFYLSANSLAVPRTKGNAVCGDCHMKHSS